VRSGCSAAAADASDHDGDGYSDLPGEVPRLRLAAESFEGTAFC
jgi:hypothetical protein